MKNFKDENNIIWEFEENCFDENGQATNEIVMQKITENNLISITDEKAEAIRNYKSPEQIVEEERLEKLPNYEEQEKMKIELILINLLEQGGMI